jgi:hypothetical protein
MAYCYFLYPVFAYLLHLCNQFMHGKVAIAAKWVPFETRSGCVKVGALKLNVDVSGLDLLH